MLELINESDAPIVLIVDDSENERALMRKELRSAHFQVLEARDGSQALAMLREHQPDVVLLDVNMPQMDGIETCREIRLLAMHQHTPVLMLTGMDGLEYIRRAFDAGATDFITKSTNLAFITQRVRYALRNSQHAYKLTRMSEALKKAQRTAKLGSWQLQVSDCRLTLSDEAMHIIGLQAEEFDNTFSGYLDFVPLTDRENLKAAFDCALFDNVPFNIDHPIVRRDATDIYVNLQAEVVFDENAKPVQMIGVVQDITERKRVEAQIEHQAFYDSLTDLSNRRLFQDRMDHAMAMAHREEKLLAVCFFDLDNFKMINDNLGHAVGDELLKSVAKRLRSTMRQGDVIARISGDEFALAIEGLSNVDELEKIVDKLRRRLAEPYRIRGHKIYASASIGIALYPLDSSDKESMLSYADAAMYRAKELGGNTYCYYTYDMNDKARRRLEMESHLSRAVENKEMRVYYQPQIDVASGKVIGVEALVRWEHPEYGLLPPVKFLNIAEETGIIFSIGRWALHTAFKQMVIWQHLGLRGLRLAINMSARQFAQENIGVMVKELLRETHFDPRLLIVEITESVAMRNIEGTVDSLNQLRELGVRAALDDFGAGQSSMNLLQRLPVDELNIDRSFIMRIAEREQDGATAKAIIAMAHSLGLKVNAEGVESTNQINFLKKNHCDHYQGFVFSAPAPAEVITEMMLNVGGLVSMTP